MATKVPGTIRQYALELGFDAIGIADPNLKQYAPYFRQFLKRHSQGDMHYLERNVEKILHPEKLLPSVKSIICVRINYFTKHDESVARFARLPDYHKILKEKLLQLVEKIKTHTKTFEYKICVDSSPILEKALAEKCGLGWIGKNTLLNHEKLGSFSFLGEILTNLDLPFDQPVQNRCGDCQKCIDACPTKALIAPYQCDAKKCIAYLTIEHRGTIPKALKEKFNGQIYGCDLCQSVCPYNQNLPETTF